MTIFEEIFQSNESGAATFCQNRKIGENYGGKRQIALSIFSKFAILTFPLHSVFQTIAKRAGLGKIIRPFDNMRMSRSNEVERKFGSKKENLWIGHSDKVMIKHYLVLEDEDYAKAAEADLESESPQNPHANPHAKPTDSDGLE
jgi:hypothetical protein